MKTPNHGKRVRVSSPEGGEWVGRPIYMPADRRFPYMERSGIELLADDGWVVCILRDDRTEVLYD